MPQIPWQVTVQDHPGSSSADIEKEPDWAATGSQHRVGFKNRQDRRPGLVHSGDEQSDEVPELSRSSSSEEDLDDEEAGKAAEAKFAELRARKGKGELLSFADIITHEPDLHLQHPENKSIGWRYVLKATEDGVKYGQDWPANAERKKKEEQAKAAKESKTGDGVQIVNRDDAHKEKEGDEGQEENDWRRKQDGAQKHHDAYAGDSSASDKPTTEYQKLLERYTPQEIALLKSLQHEKDYRKSLKNNEGKRKSPQTQNRTTIAIDEQDQFSPDNWLPRSDHLIRLTGKHPLNAEAELTTLFDGGLITPNELHYVRNHGAVPRLIWEFHELDVESGKLVLSMDDIKQKFDAINIPVALACDGNRRKELNMLKKSKGFNWGSGATGCAYWKGPLLRDVLAAAGVEVSFAAGNSDQRWVNFEGADDPSEGKYATSIPLAYAMDPTNDVLLAYEMNDEILPPDHGYPLRVMIPGYVGGRCVKWLKKIWVSEEENDSYYHIWDNRVLPSFITEKDGDFATAMFNHPDTACNEQNLNSVIVKPAQGEKLVLGKVHKGDTYRIEGYAYDGGGHEVQRVEVSLDEGETWLYCIRKFPDYPIRHGNKFWTWIHWYVDVSTAHLLKSKGMSVRAWNVFKNTQPQKPSWNTMGMMNNAWYTVKPEISEDGDESSPTILFRHPVEPGTGDGGWMKPSVENQISAAKQAAGAPQKQFTREEIEKHDTDSDCWIVVDGKVYDATSVLAWHPGGKAAITSHAGKVHQETSDEFASIHDDFAYQKLKECILGVVTDKAAQHIKANAEAMAKEKAASKTQDGNVVLQKHKWVPVTLTGRESLSSDTQKYTFTLPEETPDLGLGTCQHIQLGFHMQDKMLIRSYTPTAPILPDPKNDKSPQPTNNETASLQDGAGTFSLVVKTYPPTPSQPGGAMSTLLANTPLHSQLDIRGPTGEITYLGRSRFSLDAAQQQTHTFKRISLVLGGSGITPGYALIARIVLGAGEGDADVRVRVVDANKSESDILLRAELEDLEKKSNGRVKVTHVLSHASDKWSGLKGHVNEQVLKDNLFAPGEDGAAVFLCGPPGLIQKGAMPALKGEFPRAFLIERRPLTLE